LHIEGGPENRPQISSVPVSTATYVTSHEPVASVSHAMSALPPGLPGLFGLVGEKKNRTCVDVSVRSTPFSSYTLALIVTVPPGP
jgi:hypothetical protein